MSGQPPAVEAPSIPTLPIVAGHGSILVYLIGAAFVVFLVWLFIKLRPTGRTGGGGGLNYVVGPMGAGKSLFGVRAIVASICKGNYAVSNVRLVDGWAERVCRKEFPRDWHRGGDRRRRRLAWLEGHYIFERSLEEAMRYRVPGRGEARAVFVWDETHNDLNNRDYQGHGATKDLREAEKERRRLVLRWATQLRKLGFVGYLLSQHQENTDAQLRRVCNHIIRLQNQRARGGFGALLPGRLTLFLAYWYPAHLADGTRKVEALRFERYVLPWHRHLYDSWETFHGLDDELDDAHAPIALPAGGRRPAPVGASAGAVAAEPVAERPPRMANSEPRPARGAAKVDRSPRRLRTQPVQEATSA
jgi:zonular occludens toxin Zot